MFLIQAPTYFWVHIPNTLRKSHALFIYNIIDTPCPLTGVTHFTPIQTLPAKHSARPLWRRRKFFKIVGRRGGGGGLVGIFESNLYNLVLTSKRCWCLQPAWLCVREVYMRSPVGTYCITVSPHCIFTKAGTKFQHPKHSRALKSEWSLTVLNEKTFQSHYLACFVSAQTPPCPPYAELSSQHVDRKGWGSVRGEMDDIVALFPSISWNSLHVFSQAYCTYINHVSV